jgi:site-specific recombinase XerD
VIQSGLKSQFKISPHALRHSALTLLAKSGVELIDLKYLAGHQDISTTMIYIHSVQTYEDHVGMYHPLNK